MAIAQAKPATRKGARVLVVDDEPTLMELLEDAVTPQVPCRLIGAGSVAEARRAMAAGGIDLLVTDVMLPDGSGLLLLDELRRQQPDAAALVVTGVPNIEVAIEAMRGGAVDFLRKPFTADDLTERVRQALLGQRQRHRQHARLGKLKKSFKRLNAARRIVNRKVDLLCNDLIGAYGELSRQLDNIRLQEGFRQCIDRANGLEQLLCHAMDWLLRQLGYCNIGIWLASSDQDLQLGAYMKYTIPGQKELTEAVQRNLLRMAQRRGFVRLRGQDAAAHLTPPELRFLADQDVLAINCTYLGDTLAVMALFRDQKTPFCDDDVTALKTVSPLFALALARAVKTMDGGTEAPPDAPAEGPTAEPEETRKPDIADWWKTGESPPF